MVPRVFCGYLSDAAVVLTVLEAHFCGPGPRNVRSIMALVHANMLWEVSYIKILGLNVLPLPGRWLWQGGASKFRKPGHTSRLSR